MGSVQSPPLAGPKNLESVHRTAKPHLISGPILHQVLHPLHHGRHVLQTAQVQKRLWARRKLPHIGGPNYHWHRARLQHLKELFGDVIGVLAVLEGEGEHVRAGDGHLPAVALCALLLVVSDVLRLCGNAARGGSELVNGSGARSGVELCVVTG